MYPNWIIPLLLVVPPQIHTCNIVGAGRLFYGLNYLQIYTYVCRIDLYVRILPIKYIKTHATFLIYFDLKYIPFANELPTERALEFISIEIRDRLANLISEQLADWCNIWYSASK